jgi:hypothetical protein
MYEKHTNSLKFSTLYKIREVLLEKKDGEFKDLKQRFKCLSPYKVNSLKDEVKPLSELVKYQLAGFRYSTSYQCRIAYGSHTYSCFDGKLPKNCKYQCMTKKGEHRWFCEYSTNSLLDGTKCDEDKICLLGQCTHIKEIGIDKQHYNSINPLIHCPQGFDQFRNYKDRRLSHHIFNNMINDEYRRIYDTKSCKQLIAEQAKLSPDHLLCKSDEYADACCEECAKFRINIENCDLNGCKEDFCTEAFNPCVNGGICFLTDDDFECKCPQGFKGSLCMERSGCDPNPCKNDGECFRLGDGGNFYCKCKIADLMGSPTCDRDNSTYSALYSIKKAESFTIYILMTFISITIILIILIIYFK